MINTLENTYFKLFANCVTSRGVTRSIIIDYGRDSFITIPDSMHDVIDLFCKKKCLSEVYTIYGEDGIPIINEYVEFLVDGEFGFITSFDEYDRFTDIDQQFSSPSHINNCVVEYSEIIVEHIKKLLLGLDNLQCRNLQIISYNPLTTEQLITLLSETNQSDLRSLELILGYSHDLMKFLPQFSKYNQRLTEIVIHNVNGRLTESVESEFLITFKQEQIISFAHCGVIGTQYFDVNRDKVIESFSNNSCLNKKIGVDQNGFIKNCPALPMNFGNLINTTLEDAFKAKGFKNYWQTTKDQIQECQDCEFRHICTDCRAFLENPEDILSKPLKCGYDPYTGEWSDWSKNPLKQKAIKHYGMQELIKKNV